MGKLTAKQETFVQGLVSGLSQRKAYREAYPKSVDWKDKTVDNRASELMNSGEVLGRYQELISEHKQKALWTREQAVNELLAIIQEAKNEMKESGLTSGVKSALMESIRELNKIESVHGNQEEQRELLKAQTEHIKAKTGLIVGVQHDMGLMQTLADVLTQKEQDDLGTYKNYDEWLIVERSEKDGINV